VFAAAEIEEGGGHELDRCTKTETSVRAVPLQAIALAALDQLPTRRPSELLFRAVNGGYLDLHNFRNRDWKPPPYHERGEGADSCGFARSGARLRLSLVAARCRVLHRRATLVRPAIAQA
jgi:hypothetical protein